MRVVSRPDPEAAYFQSVEEFFVSRRGDPLFLSNADWTLVRRWRVVGIPLRVVLRGIRDALDAHAQGFGRGRKVGSLAYCAREVEAASERWRRALAVSTEESGGVPEVLAGFARDLETAVNLGPWARRVAHAVARELRDRRGSARLEELTPWLAEREKRLVEALEADDPPEERTARERELEATLLQWRKRMPAHVIEAIRQESRARRTLEAHGLPRLSLFHLAGDGDADS